MIGITFFKVFSSPSVKVLILFFIILVALPFMTPVRGEPENWPGEALEVLNRFLGNWETQTWIHHHGPPPRDFRTKGRAVCRQTLGGRYYEFRTWSIPPQDEDLQIMTYDLKTGLYQQWLFDSGGYHHEAAGRWDPITSTLWWEGRADGNSFIIKDRFVAPGRLEWTLKRMGPDGRLIQSIKGVVTRLEELPSKPQE